MRSRRQPRDRRLYRNLTPRWTGILGGGLAPFLASKGSLRRCGCCCCLWAVNGAISATESRELATRKELRKKGKRHTLPFTSSGAVDQAPD
jgi:hypothetical protein